MERQPEALEARFLLGAALRRSGALRDALAVLAPLATKRGAWGLHYEHGMTLAALGASEAAAEALGRASNANPQSSLAWHALGDQRAMLGQGEAAQAAQTRALPGSIGDPALAAAAMALFERRPGAAEALRTRFGFDLNDVAAVRLIADIGMRQGQFAAVEPLLAAALASAPGFVPARYAHAVVLHRSERGAEALGAITQALRARPALPMFLALDAAIHLQLDDADSAIATYDTLLRATPDDPEAWHAYGHALRAVGRQADAVAAYRRALALAPGFGEAYWSLANLKTVRFTHDEIARMEALPASAYRDFALGKALEDEGRYAQAFDHYARGNAIRKTLEPHDAQAHHRFVTESIAGFDAALFARHADTGWREAGPIFVFGMPRSGSTLVEQILASHSQVEGASELADITTLARGLAAGTPGYPGSVAQVPATCFAELGQVYLERTRIYRTTAAPLFVDKFPGNFLHAGLIHLMVPGARIIDVRRGAVACCFSLFKQAFARGQAYSYDLEDLAHYYTDYVALMAHFDAMLPGRIHRVGYEALVADPEREIRRLLSYCGLAFEPGCLRFFETDRTVRTPSSEQVRQPIFRDGLDQWRHFEPWLGTLIAALGPLASGAASRP